MPTPSLATFRLLDRLLEQLGRWGLLPQPVPAPIPVRARNPRRSLQR
jgi:hypothetical protein